MPRAVGSDGPAPATWRQCCASASTYNGRGYVVVPDVLGLGRLKRQGILVDREFWWLCGVCPVLSTNIGGTSWHVADDRPSRSS